MLYQIDVGYACAGVVTHGDVVSESAPIFKWMIGKELKTVVTWVKNKGGTIILVCSCS